jgi:membrane-associated phospholipid phosphatase
MTAASGNPARAGGYLHELAREGWFSGALSTAYALTLAWFGELRPEHVVLALGSVGAWLASRPTREIMREAAPVFLIVYGFDSIRYVRSLFVTVDRVHGCDIRALEIRLFGAGPDMALADYFNVHHSLGFDVFFSIPYGAFIYVTIAYAIAAWFRDRQRARAVAWSFVAMYLLAFVGWMAVPSAPPWYIQAHGCAIDLSTPTNAAALARVDQALGISYFDGFYGRGPNAFGAMPSIHNAYPILTLLSFWPIAGWKERAAGVLYAAWMMAASVYLDHHWVLDGLAGWIIAATGVLVGNAIARAFPAPPPRAKAAAPGALPPEPRVL